MNFSLSILYCSVYFALFFFYCQSVFGQIWVPHSLASSKLLALFHFLLFITVHQDYASSFNFKIIHFIVCILNLSMEGGLLPYWPTCSWCCLHWSSPFSRALWLSYCRSYWFGSLNHSLCYGLCYVLFGYHFFVLIFLQLHLFETALCDVCLVCISVS